MKICVAGMGIIGGSLALSLRRAEYKVDGWNRSPLPLEYALNNGVIDGKAVSFTDYDFVFVALPPRAAVDFINSTHFKDGAIVSDICGIKEWVEREIYSRERNFRYVGCHPMAGKEVSGVENSCSDLFDGASMIITHCVNTDISAVETLKTLTKAMGFGRIIECSAAIHDSKIAYTSQLAHIVSNAYVKDGEIDCCLGFTGGSFQDMTRIAGVDENVWAELYLITREKISEKISALIRSLDEIRGAIDGGDEENLRKILKEGRVLYEQSKKNKSSNEISVTNLR